MEPLFQEPAGREARPAWAEVPSSIIGQLQKLLGQDIVHAGIAWGGYSPNADFVARLASGKKVFIKGTHPGQDAHGAESLRQEIRLHKTMDGLHAFSPAYLGCVSDGGGDGGWMLAVFDHIDAVPALPWTREKITAVFQLLARLHGKQEALPELPQAEDMNFIQNFLKPEGGWLRIRSESAITGKFLTLFEDEEAGRRWLSRALPPLCAWLGKAAETEGPRGPLHLDLRSDNILFDRDGRVYLVDWPNACVGPVALDLVYFLSSISAESALAAPPLLDLYQDISSLEIGEKDLSICLASLSGYMADNAYRAVPAKLPRLRWMQKSLLWAMLQWAVVLLDIPPPPRFTGLRHD